MGCQGSKSETKSPRKPRKDEICINANDFIEIRDGKFEDFYEKGRRIGHGSFGSVFECTEIGQDAVWAVKIIDKTNLSAREQKRMYQEISTLKKLDNPSIIKIKECLETDEEFYIISELVKGGELFDDLVKRKRYSEKDASIIIRQILEAVAFCHDHNIVHRDLKPENLLIDENDHNHIKVIDFGTSIEFDPKKKMHRMYGTCYYIAPEVLEGSYGKECDVWSIGVILYVLVTGSVPFGGSNDKEIMKSVARGNYPKSLYAYKQLSFECKDLIA